MDLQLDHVASLSEILTPTHLGVILGLLILALIVLTLTHRWWGLLLGLLILGVALTGGVYLGLQLKTNLSDRASTQVLATNIHRIQPWVKTRYALNLSAAQTAQLAAGTESFNPATHPGDAKFGTLPAIDIHITGGDIQVPVTLIYVKHAWLLGYTQDGKLLKVPDV